jgi:hypothetical protein
MPSSIQALLCSKGSVRKQTEKAHQQPVSMYIRMRIVTTVECRHQLMWRTRIGSAIHSVRDVAWILLMQALEREVGEPLRRRSVQWVGLI